MRIFHLADLHIGKKLNGVPLLEDQKAVLEQVLAEITYRQPDVLILAGDVYDRRMPPVEAVNLLDEFLSKVVLDLKVTVLVIGGNHDSGERLGFANGILAKAGLHVAGRLSLPIYEVVKEDDYGKVYFHLLPYADLATIRYLLQEETLTDYQEAMAAVLATLKQHWVENERHVLIAHGVVIGEEEPQYSESERELSIGGTECWSSNLLQQFDYVALGHLHRAQCSGNEAIRYAGAPLKYSFAEENQEKSLVQIDLTAKGQRKITLIPLKPLREMRTIKGTLQTLLREQSEDYIRAILTDTGELLEPMAQLKTAYPYILELSRENQQLPQSSVNLPNLSVKNSPQTLFAEFYRQILGEEMTEAETNWLLKILDAVHKEAI